MESRDLVIVILLTNAKFEDEGDGDDGPDGVTAGVLVGIFPEDEKRDDSESQTHLGGEDDLPRI